jgi:ABC-type nitrate/sulfonate/bicarbonate transport system permease component
MLRSTCVSLTSLLTAIALWWLVSWSGLVSPFVLPSPSGVFGALGRVGRGYLGSSLPDHVFASFGVVLAGFLAAAAGGLMLGIAMAWVPAIERIASPLVSVLRPIPAPAWIPLAILWFGIGLGGKVFVVFMAAITPCLINAFVAIRDVPNELLQAARSLGASRWELLVRVAIPAGAPTMAIGLRIGLGVAWASIVAAEMVVATAGFGFLISSGYRNFEADIMGGGMVAVALAGLGMDGLFQVLEHAILGERRNG